MHRLDSAFISTIIIRCKYQTIMHQCSLYFITSHHEHIFHRYRNQAEPVKGPPTNNRGEIQAASKAIELSAKSNVKKVCINTDSQFLIDSATKWMKGWKAKGWKLSSGKPVKNENDFRELDRVVNSNPDVEVKWTYVPAHSGIPGNEHADTLAKQGAQKYKNERN